MSITTIETGTLVLNKYRISRPLARGGMGLVYLARTEGAEGFVKPVIVKQVLSGVMTDEPIEAMFIREAQILAQLDHPHIVDVIDFGQHEDGYVMVLEYIRGFHFGQWLKHRRGSGAKVPVWAVVHVMRQVLAACEYTHSLHDREGKSAQVIHRDISPSNILIHEGGYAKLVDYGVATSRLDETDHRKVKGKAAYMAPELINGKPPSPCTDVYAAAVVLYEALAGKNPFRECTFERTLIRTLKHEPAPLDEVNPKVPSSLAKVVTRALSKSPKDRFKTAAGLSRALSNAMGRALVDSHHRFQLLVRADFREDALPDKLKRPSLAQLDRAWVNTPVPDDLPVEPEVVSDDIEVTTPSYGSFDPSNAGPVRPPWMLWTAITTLVATALLVASSTLSVEAVSTPVTVLVQQEVPRSDPMLDTGNPGGEPRPTPPTTVTSPSTSAASPSEGPHADLARPVIAAGGEIRDCLASPLTPLEQDLALSLRFVLNRQGEITDASLSPEPMNAIPAGECILRVARSLRFPPQPHPISFRVPMSASSPRSPGGNQP